MYSLARIKLIGNKSKRILKQETFNRGKIKLILIVKNEEKIKLNAEIKLINTMQF